MGWVLISNTPAQQNLHIALDLMRLLVDIEKKKNSIEFNMEKFCVCETHLRERVSFLEGQLSEVRTSLRFVV